jgi:hypothetical protein
MIGGKYGFIDPSGKVVIEPIYEEATSFKEGLAMVRLGTKRMFINLYGKKVF